jgi:hypothetical protein
VSMLLEDEETILLVWRQSLKSILKLFIGSSSPQNLIIRRLFMDVSFHFELIHVDIGGDPPIPTGSSYLFFFNTFFCTTL